MSSEVQWWIWNDNTHGIEELAMVAEGTEEFLTEMTESEERIGSVGPDEILTGTVEAIAGYLAANYEEIETDCEPLIQIWNAWMSEE